jgi:predicted 3-demethylubiquinone-9 3-methyltransferase (glyoxalase superfamily)
MQKITPCLWFENQAEEAANFYMSVFENARVVHATRYGEGAPVPAGTVLIMTIELDGLQIQLLNGGPGSAFSEATSLSVSVQSQEELDRFWDALTSDGGQEGQCGWLKDRFGFSWQIVPGVLATYISDPDTEKAGRAQAAMMGMKKLSIPDLEAAYNGV